MIKRNRTVIVDALNSDFKRKVTKLACLLANTPDDQACNQFVHEIITAHRERQDAVNETLGIGPENALNITMTIGEKS